MEGTIVRKKLVVVLAIAGLLLAGCSSGGGSDGGSDGSSDGGSNSASGSDASRLPDIPFGQGVPDGLFETLRDDESPAGQSFSELNAPDGNGKRTDGALVVGSKSGDKATAVALCKLVLATGYEYRVLVVGPVPKETILAEATVDGCVAAEG